MVKILHVAVVDKIATFRQRDGVIVCGNKGYRVKFTFDSEWDGLEVKTARFIYNNTVVDKVFEGDTVDVPVIRNAPLAAVGVFVGDLQTTTPAFIPCTKSILCSDGLPPDPEPDVYAQIMELLANGSGGKDGEDGKSAYEIAVAHGFKGSEAEWLASLKGEPGEPGQPGGPGDPGQPGTSVTITSVTESDESGGENVVTFSDNKTLIVKNGKDGVGIIGIDEMGGDATRTAYRINFTDGTWYEFDVYHGEDGASVTITSITESDESGGENVVTFSDGKKLTIKNGKDGSNTGGGDCSAVVVSVDYDEPTDTARASHDAGEIVDLINSGVAVIAVLNGRHYLVNEIYYSEDGTPYSVKFTHSEINNEGEAVTHGITLLYDRECRLISNVFEVRTELPEVTTSDNGKFLRVVNGAWAAVALTDVSQVGG